MLKSSVNWGQYSDDRQAAYDRVADARQKKLDAEVQAKRERDAQGSDSQQLGALVVQGGLAYATGGASLAYAPMIDKASWTAMGKPQAAGTGISGAASSLGQVGYGLAQGNKAETLAQGDKAFERNMANQERRYKALMDAGYEEAAFDLTSDMQAMDEGYQKNRQGFMEGSQTGEGFLDNMFGRGKMETDYDKYSGPRVSKMAETDFNQNKEAVAVATPSTQKAHGPLSYLNDEHKDVIPEIEEEIETSKKAKKAEYVSPMSLTSTKPSINPNKGKRFKGEDGRYYEYDKDGKPVPVIEGAY